VDRLADNVRAIAITLIQPTEVDTPFPQQAKNYMMQEPKLPTPQIDPEQVAEAILDAAVQPTRSKKVGMMAKINTTMSNVLPGIADKVSAKQAERQEYQEQPRHPQGALYRPSETTTVVGQSHGAGGRE
jgi:short-subunit dehydrogenase